MRDLIISQKILGRPRHQSQGQLDIHESKAVVVDLPAVNPYQCWDRDDTELRCNYEYVVLTVCYTCTQEFLGKVG